MILNRIQTDDDLFDLLNKDGKRFLCCVCHVDDQWRITTHIRKVPDRSAYSMKWTMLDHKYYESVSELLKDVQLLANNNSRLGCYFVVNDTVHEGESFAEYWSFDPGDAETLTQLILSN